MAAAVLVGLVSGFLAGLLGIGGGFVFVPLIMTFYSDTGIHRAIATSCGFAVAAGLSSFATHIKKASPYFNIAAGFLVGSLAGASIGPFISLMITEDILTKLFAAIVLLPFIMRIIRFSIKPRIPTIVAMGVVIGCFSSIFGIGGGILVTPVLVQAFNLDLRRSLTTSALFITVNSSIATAVYAFNGFVMWKILLLAAPAGIAGAYLGARVSHRLKPVYIRAGLVLLVLFVITNMLFR